MPQKNQSQTDRFGNRYIVVGLRDKTGKGYPKGFAEIKSTLYKIEVSDSNKQDVESWVKITEMPRKKQGGGGF